MCFEGARLRIEKDHDYGSVCHVSYFYLLCCHPTCCMYKMHLKNYEPSSGSILFKQPATILSLGRIGRRVTDDSQATMDDDLRRRHFLSSARGLFSVRV